MCSYWVVYLLLNRSLIVEHCSGSNGELPGFVNSYIIYFEKIPLKHSNASSCFSVPHENAQKMQACFKLRRPRHMTCLFRKWSYGELDDQYHLRNLHSFCSIIRPVFKIQSQTTSVHCLLVWVSNHREQPIMYWLRLDNWYTGKDFIRHKPTD